MARSGDMERWGKAMEDVDQLKRSEELQVDTLFELWYYIEKKTEELGKQITELQRDNEKLRDEVCDIRIFPLELQPTGEGSKRYVQKSG
ncbi:hypothetical protein Pmar_PMAR003495 [Perkinsus marinus ATCC 50983]|uniref:Uncharacterized protein n=1 Tax=Perkinsus marinus (strain ATCC 50983 / TXsc) TaxID=423536 RepID=C5KHH0_PERM5|nr:hypothetical protein Pmar_PMAR003495 [Perkinsus marinus ATCC 50983]EER16032.1 hypothetical protein Pmar_PMAR003495 [Perkinsus marinus ATCC 50983]|eukprot:XP_002784236.1 hypothetical protein Pmar_PMAR003495 [Perkinsus marinus ATCC 50983]